MEKQLVFTSTGVVEVKDIRHPSTPQNLYKVRGKKKVDSRFYGQIGKQERHTADSYGPKIHVHTNAGLSGKTPMTSPSLLTTGDTLLFSSMDSCCTAPAGHTHPHTPMDPPSSTNILSGCLGLLFHNTYL